jgi:hypothetical protein
VDHISAPEKILLFAAADDGEVGFMDVDGFGRHEEAERHIVGRSMRPVAVAYDPLHKVRLAQFGVPQGAVLGPFLLPFIQGH